MESMVIKALVDADTYEAAKEVLVPMNTSPETYISMCLTETVRQREHFLERYRNGAPPQELLREIADLVFDRLQKEYCHEPAAL